MKTITLLLAVLTAVVPAEAVPQDIGTAELTPLVTASGEHRFQLVTQVPKVATKAGVTDEQWIEQTLESRLAAAHWCLDGWEITKQHPQKIGAFVVEGRCL